MRSVAARVEKRAVVARRRWALGLAATPPASNAILRAGGFGGRSAQHVVESYMGTATYRCTAETWHRKDLSTPPARVVMRNVV